MSDIANGNFRYILAPTTSAETAAKNSGHQTMGWVTAQH
jgi:hypothetical protein